MTTTALLEDIEPQQEAQLTRVGYGLEREHSATCVIVDQSVSHVRVNDPNVEVLPLADALDRYEWVQDLVFGLIDPSENELVRQLAESTDPPLGHFVWVHDDAKVTLPVQLFTVLATAQGRQHIHDVRVIGKNAEVDLVCGSITTGQVHTGHHVSISETYLREGAQCREVSIEQWGSAVQVDSFSRTHLEKKASMTTNAIMMTGLKRHASDSQTILSEGAVSSDQSIVFAPEGTERVMVSDIVLAGDKAHAESLARMVTAGGQITNRSTITGDGNDTNGYLGCDGLKLGDKGQIHSAPALVANSPSSQLSHEASIGMVSQERMAYLMATGMTEERARDLIIQGFLHLDDQKIPESIREEVMQMVAVAKSGAL